MSQKYFEISIYGKFLTNQKLIFEKLKSTIDFKHFYIPK